MNSCSYYVLIHLNFNTFTYHYRHQEDMMSGIKRNGPSDGPTAAKKKPRVDRDMDTDFVASSQEDLDIKVMWILVTFLQCLSFIFESSF